MGYKKCINGKCIFYIIQDLKMHEALCNIVTRNAHGKTRARKFGREEEILFARSC